VNDSEGLFSGSRRNNGVLMRRISSRAICALRDRRVLWPEKTAINRTRREKIKRVRNGLVGGGGGRGVEKGL